MPVATLAQIVSEFTLEVTFSALDSNSKLDNRRKVYYLTATGADAATRAAAARTARDAFITDLGAMTEALITGHRLTEVYGTSDAVAAVADVYKELVVQFRLATVGDKKASHTLPAPADAILANGKTLNTAAPGVSDWIANYQLTGGVVTISDGEFVSDTNPVASSDTRRVSSGKSY